MSETGQVERVGMAVPGIDTSRLRVLLDVSAERDRQDSDHPALEGYFHERDRSDILMEEVGEVSRAQLERHTDEMRAELVQVAAVAVRWIEALDTEEGSNG